MTDWIFGFYAGMAAIGVSLGIARLIRNSIEWAAWKARTDARLDQLEGRKLPPSHPEP